MSRSSPHASRKRFGYVVGPLSRRRHAQVFVVRGARLERQPVSFGIASVDFFEVTDGLMPGDEVVISDMRDYLD